MRICMQFLLLIIYLVNAGCKTSEVEALSPDPTVNLSVPVIAGGFTALNSAGSATLTLTFTDAVSTHLKVATGSTSAPPAGLAVSTMTATCSAVDITSVSINEATIEVSGCNGDGTLSISVEAGVLIGKNAETNMASATQIVNIDNTEPTATLALSSAVVGTADGNNIATVTFSELVQNLSVTNANGEFTVAGCTNTDPDITIAMSVNGLGRSVATATLANGDCVDGDIITVSFNLEKVNDIAGNEGLVLDNPSPETYVVETDIPVATLAPTVYPALTSAVNSTATALLALSYTNADATTLADGSGSSTAPPVGITVIENGATCSNVEVANSSILGADITIAGCTGDGSITVQVAAGTASNMGVHSNVASAVRTVLIQNATPTATLAVENDPGDIDGGNTITVTMNQLVQPLSSNNSNGEFTVAGCTTTDPNVSVVMTTDGSGNSVAIATLSGGNCDPGDIVSVSLDTSHITNLAGDVGTVSPAAVTYNIANINK